MSPFVTPSHSFPFHSLDLVSWSTPTPTPFFFFFYIHTNIKSIHLWERTCRFCFSESEWSHFMRYFTGPLISLRTSQFQSSVLGSKIPWCIHATFLLPVFLLMSNWAGSISFVLWIDRQLTWMFKYHYTWLDVNFSVYVSRKRTVELYGSSGFDLRGVFILTCRVALLIYIATTVTLPQKLAQYTIITLLIIAFLTRWDRIS